MKFLTRIGAIILKGIEIYAGFAPIIQTAFPGFQDKVQVLSNDLVEIANIIVQVESFGQALAIPGPQKLIAATPAVSQIILRSAILANHSIADPILFKQGCTKIADGMADVLNSLDDKIPTQNKT